MNALQEKIEQAINSVSGENGSNTPDFILAEFLIDCLATFDKAVQQREEWYGRWPQREEIWIVFDGPPGPVSGRFVEVEISCGKSVRAGKWEKRGDYWYLGPFIDAIQAQEPTIPTTSINQHSKGEAS